MHAAYFETHFLTESPALPVWPAAFAVITAWAPTGEIWTREQNEAADRQLEAKLRQSEQWRCRLTGYSPVTGHAEPGWAAELPLEAACGLGREFHQDAIYYVTGDTLWVSFCDERRKLVEVGPFRERIHAPDVQTAQAPAAS